MQGTASVAMEVAMWTTDTEYKSIEDEDEDIHFKGSH